MHNRVAVRPLVAVVRDSKEVVALRSTAEAIANLARHEDSRMDLVSDAPPQFCSAA
jgi:hypothetical protein